MADPSSFTARKDRFFNRWHAARAAQARVAAGGFKGEPEPLSIGSDTKGRQLLAGDFLFAGHLLQQPGGADIWGLDAPSGDYLRDLHGFAWLDDLAAVGDGAARDAARAWLWNWIDRYGRGRGPGWVPDLAGRRVSRWINHGAFLLHDVDDLHTARFFRSLARQALFLSHRWHAARAGLPRLEALLALLQAGLAVEGLGDLAEPARRGLDREAAAAIDAAGGLPSRNPEALLDIFTLLGWAAAALGDADHHVPEAHRAAIARIAPTLRILRHSDGGLARFHGGGRGMDGRLDAALARSRVRARHADGRAMGYVRLAGGRSSIIIDAGLPPKGFASVEAHASTLAFELTSGRRPLIVNCGSGRGFGPEWRRAGRATPSHSTLCLDGLSSARLGPKDHASGLEPLVDGPTQVPVELGQISDGLQFQGGHDGYAASHGLTHARTLEISFDGRGLAGEDMLLALSDAEKERFGTALDATGTKGVAFDIRFHLHPDVHVSQQAGEPVVTLELRSGEKWLFRHDGTQRMRLEPSVFLETGRLKPRRTNQIVLSGRAMSYATRVRWSLSKTDETAIGLRDIVPDTPDDFD